jgi:hypothetical protein
MPIKNLLVATDFTDRSERAVERALQLRNLAGRGRLTLLHVIAAGLPPELINRPNRKVCVAGELEVETRIDGRAQLGYTKGNG